MKKNTQNISEALSGLGRLERQRLSLLLLKCEGVLTVNQAAQILDLSKSNAAKLLALFAKKGWLSRLRQGAYMPVSLLAQSSDVVPEDPMLVGQKLFEPSYIGGWSAAEYWGLTEQIFNTVLVVTQKKPRDRRPVIKGTRYMLRTIGPKSFFGLKEVWIDQAKVLISDREKTIIDLMIDPVLGGGLRSTVDILSNYFSSDKIAPEKMIKYVLRLKNGAVSKRLGFLLEKFFPEQKLLIEACKKTLTSGNAKLDPSISAHMLVTQWRLWVPKEWKSTKND